jgi:ABC-type amino acid transport substrate-binding protein
MRLAYLARAARVAGHRDPVLSFPRKAAILAFLPNTAPGVAMLRRIALCLAALSTVLCCGAPLAQAPDGRLKKIVQSRNIAIAFRSDATPFSFLDEKIQVSGFSIDLCKRVVASIARQFEVPLKINWVPVTAATRFEAVARGQADMECGSSTVSLSRLKQVDFSSYIFVASTGLLVKEASGARKLADLAGKTIAVIAGTTNERAIQAQLKRRKIEARLAAFKSREEALAALDAGTADAFAWDKLLLVGAAASRPKNASQLLLLAEDFSFEPYGIVLPLGDTPFRMAVNAGLAEVYSTGDITEIFNLWFAPLGPPSPLLEAVYIFGAIPE